MWTIALLFARVCSCWYFFHVYVDTFAAPCARLRSARQGATEAGRGEAEAAADDAGTVQEDAALGERGWGARGGPPENDTGRLGDGEARGAGEGERGEGKAWAL